MHGGRRHRRTDDHELRDGRRFVIADGVERWKDADAEAVAAAMAGMDGDTMTVALFGREEGRYKVPPPGCVMQ